MKISESRNTLAAALQSARALSNQTLVRPKEAAAMANMVAGSTPPEQENDHE